VWVRRYLRVTLYNRLDFLPSRNPGDPKMPRLTVAGINRYRASHKRREIRDSALPGLYLIVQPTGQKSFCMRFCRPDGRAAKLVLGPFVDDQVKMPDASPVIGMPLTLAAAHELCARLHRQRKLGTDVIGDYLTGKQQSRLQVKQGAATAYPVVLRQFIAEHAKPHTRRWREAARLLGLDYPADVGEPTVIKDGLCDRWATKPVNAVVPDDIHNIVDEVRRQGTPGLPCKRKREGLADAQARVVLATLSSFFGWCARERRIPSNPCANIEPPRLAASRNRVLNNAEIAAFWTATEKVGEPATQMLRLLLLTGARRDEVRCMRYSELSADGVWTIPGERTKNHRVHVLPLPKLARDILGSVKRKAGSDFVFTHNGKVAVRINSHIKRRLDEAMMKPTPWVIHDLRRTCVTQMSEIGVQPHIIEAVVNHVSGSKGGVAGIYNHAEHTAEKKAALERWAAHVESIVTGKPAANVLPMKAKRKQK
jgi:integrase